MTLVRTIVTISAIPLLALVGGCGSDDIKVTCDEPQPYQAVVPGKRIEVPDGLDPLDEFKEMPIPRAETPPRAADARCIELPPMVKPAI